MPMVLVRAEEVAILRPPSSNACVRRTVLYHRVNVLRIKQKLLRYLSGMVSLELPVRGGGGLSL